MASHIKKIVVFILVFTTAFSIFFYFVATHKAYDGNIYFTPQSAVKNWGLRSDEILFEFEDDNFYLTFDNNSNIKSVRKDFGLWVRSKFDSFFANTFNDIYAVTIKDNVYVYGITRDENAKEVKIIDFLQNEVNTQFKSEFIQSINARCFCLKINKSDLLLGSYSIVFIDNDNCIIPKTIRENENIISLVDKISAVSHNTNKLHTGNIKLSSETVDLKTNEQFYLVFENGEYVFQKYTESAEFYFYDDYVLFEKKTEIFTTQITARSKTNSNLYSETYKLNYTNELQELKGYSKIN